MNFTYEPLTEKQVAAIHQATLDVLWECGAEMNHPAILEIFKKHGAAVEGNIVKIPADLIENAIKSTPASFILEGVDPKHSVKIGHNDHPIMAPNTCSPFMIDDDFTRRNATFDDLKNFFKLAQTSDVCELGSTLLVFPVENATQHESIMQPVYDYFTHCTKAMGLSNACVENVCMAQEILDVLIEQEDVNKMYVSLCPISPLRFEENLLNTLIKAIEFRQPIECVPCSSAGMTGPLKAIDDTVLSNAENLALITLVQLMAPGLPMIYSVYSAITDMRTLQLSTGAPETFKMLAMCREMAKYYDIPFEMPSGGSDAKAFDVQAPMESTLGIVNAFATKTDTCTFMFGSLDTFNSASYRKFILDEETVRNVQAYIKPVDDLRDTTASLITRVGHHDTYIKNKDTLKNYRKEHHFPKFSHRMSHADYVKEHLSINDRLDKILKERLEAYEKPAIDKDKLKKLDAIRDKYL